MAMQRLFGRAFFRPIYRIEKYITQMSRFCCCKIWVYCYNFTMNGTFSEIIQGSWEWTKTILFKPFKVKKWIFLTLIALLAAEISGFNFNANLPLKGDRDKVIQTDSQSSSLASQSATESKTRLELLRKNIPLFIAIIVVGIILGILFFVLWIWIYSRFSFIFMASIVRNDASIKAPFSEFKKIGNSYFKWNMIFILFSIFVISLFIGMLIAGIIFLKDAPIVLNVILAVLWGIAIMVAGVMLAFAGVIVRDLIAPVMMKNNISFVDAWKVVYPVVSAEKSNFIKYFLIKFALRIIAAFLGGLGTMLVVLGMLIPLSLFGILLYAISHAIPEAIKWGYYGFLALIGVGSLLFIILLINSILLPIPIFFRTFSLKFLARLDDKQDLFRM